MDNAATITPKPTLYERLGGEPGVRKIVNDILDKNAGNPLIGHYFRNINMDRLKQLVFEFFSMGIGGPHQYTGRDMLTTHSGLNISEADFQFANNDTVKALEENGVGDAEKDEVIAILDSMKGDVVGK